MYRSDLAVMASWVTHANSANLFFRLSTSPSAATLKELIRLAQVDIEQLDETARPEAEKAIKELSSRIRRFMPRPSGRTKPNHCTHCGAERQTTRGTGGAFFGCPFGHEVDLLSEDV